MVFGSDNRGIDRTISRIRVVFNQEKRIEMKMESEFKDRMRTDGISSYLEVVRHLLFTPPSTSYITCPGSYV